MKKTLTLLSLIMVFALSANSQVMEASKVMSKGQQSTLTLEIPDVSSNYAEEV